MQEIVILPTYCERGHIEDVVSQVFHALPFAHVLVIDDNSPDGTAQIVQKLQRDYPGKLFCIVRSGKLGLASAYLKGFRYALEQGYSYIFQMDADLSHNPRDLPRLKEAVKDSDVAIGSRYVVGGSVEGWEFWRRMISCFGNWYARTVLRMDVHDLTGGFKGYQAHVLKNLSLEKVRSEGYAFQIELKYRAFLKGYKLKEIPISFRRRVHGVSKMNAAIVQEASWRVLEFKWMQMRGKL